MPTLETRFNLVLREEEHGLSLAILVVLLHRPRLFAEVSNTICMESAKGAFFRVLHQSHKADRPLLLFSVHDPVHRLPHFRDMMIV